MRGIVQMAEKACGRLLLLFTRIPKIDRCERPSVILAEAVGGYASAFEASRRSPILKPVTETAAGSLRIHSDGGMRHSSIEASSFVFVVWLHPDASTDAANRSTRGLSFIFSIVRIQTAISKHMVDGIGHVQTPIRVVFNGVDVFRCGGEKHLLEVRNDQSPHANTGMS